MDNITIGIITPFYNASNYIKDYLKNIEFVPDNFEFLFVDDCSTDNSCELLTDGLKKFENIKYRIISNRYNSGPSFSRLQGILVSESDYFAFLDIDDSVDFFDKRKQVQLMAESNSHWSYHDMNVLIGNKYSYTLVGKSNISEYDLFSRRLIGLGSVVISKFASPYLISQTKFRNGEDYMWWFNLFKIFGAPLYVSGISYNYRVLPGTLSRNKIRQVKSVLSIYLNNDISNLSKFKAIYYFLMYAINSINPINDHKVILPQNFN